MQTRRTNSLLKKFNITGNYFWICLAYSTLVVFGYQYERFSWLKIPWLPMSVIGTAVALFLGFKNTSAYDRLWEARKIWGAIVNNSRSWGASVIGLINDVHLKDAFKAGELPAIHRRLVMRHVAWLTALRFQLRERRPWEHPNKKSQQKYFSKVIPEYQTSLADEITPYLSKIEKDQVLSMANPATQIIALQTADLKELRNNAYTDSYGHVTLQGLLNSLYDEQGKCERIKNYPFPRQYATYNLVAVWIFVILLPLGMIDTFDDINVWYAIPFSTLIGWLYFAMEVVGEYSENPFEGRYNDIPISSLSRTIEIDLRQMLGEEQIPEPLRTIDDVLY